MDLGTGGTGASKTTGSNVASMIKFGYKDYLMLLMFISVCVNDDAALGRTDDIIQLNMQNASGVKDKDDQNVFKHMKGEEFVMSEARTYVSVEGSVKIDLLLLDMDFFSRILIDDDMTQTEQMDTASTIEYKGIAGY